MDIKIKWTQGMQFDGEADNHHIAMDAKPPIGKGAAPTPKELVAFGIAGCTGMDVVALLKKYKQTVDSFEILVHIEQTSDYPAIFKTVNLDYNVVGQIDSEKLKEAVTLSQTKYCGVSAMISATSPITYKLKLNGDLILEDRARFGISKGN